MNITKLDEDFHTAGLQPLSESLCMGAVPRCVLAIQSVSNEAPRSFLSGLCHFQEADLVFFGVFLLQFTPKLPRKCAFARL